MLLLSFPVEAGKDLLLTLLQQPLLCASIPPPSKHQRHLWLLRDTLSLQCGSSGTGAICLSLYPGPHTQILPLGSQLLT